MAKYVTNKNVDSRCRKMALVQKIQIMEFVQIQDFAALLFTFCVLRNGIIHFCYYVVSLAFDNQLHIFYFGFHDIMCEIQLYNHQAIQFLRPI